MRFLIFLLLLSLGSFTAALYILRPIRAQAMANLFALEAQLRPTCYLSRFTTKEPNEKDKLEARTVALLDDSLVSGSELVNLAPSLRPDQDPMSANLWCLFRDHGFQISYRSFPFSPAWIQWNAPWPQPPALTPAAGIFTLSSQRLDLTLALPPQDFRLTSKAAVSLEIEVVSPTVVKLVAREGSLDVAPRLLHAPVNRETQVLRLETGAAGNLTISGQPALGPKETALAMPSGLTQKQKLP